MKQIIIISIAAIVIILIGTAGLLASQTWNPSWNPFAQPAGKQTVEQAIEKLFEQKSLKSAGFFELQFASTTEQGADSSITLEYEAAVDNLSKKNQKASGALELSVIMQDMAMQAGLNFKSIDDILYIKIGSLPFIASMFLGQEVTQAIENQWLKIEQEQIQDIVSSQSNEQEIEKNSKKLLFELKELVQGKKFFNLKKNLGLEELDNNKAEHYLAELNKETIKEIIPQYFNLAKEYLPSAQKTAYQSQMEQDMALFMENFDNAWEQAGGIELELWIDQKESVLSRIKFEKEISSEQIKANFKIDLRFFDFGKSIEIEAPEQSRNIEDVFAPIIENIPVETLIPDYNDLNPILSPTGQ